MKMVSVTVGNQDIGKFLMRVVSILQRMTRSPW
jgi:hypothetical protein